mgnify:CR=1 FL=1
MSELLDCDEILEVVAPEPVLTDKGLNCPIEEYQNRSALVKLCMETYPGVDAHMVEILVDQHLQHPETLVEKMESDEVFMRKFKK